MTAKVPPEEPGAHADGRADEGGAVVRASWWGTGGFVAVSVAGVLVAPLRPVALVVDAALFAIGVVAFLWAYGRVLGRSRTEQIGVTGVYFLSEGAAPPGVRRSLLGALGVQVVVALVTAAARPYTALAAGVLVPMYGLALCGVWAARHGRFPRR